MTLIQQYPKKQKRPGKKARKATQEAFNRANGCCEICAQPAPMDGFIQTRGGEDNGLWLCHECLKIIDSLIVGLGCIACRRSLGVYTPAWIHHHRKLETSKKRIFAPKIGLCPIHHQTGIYGVALHAGEQAFEEKFGSVMGMVEETNNLLRG